LVRVLAVNNYPTAERFERLVASLEACGAEVAEKSWTEVPQRFGGFDGVVLSGSPDMMSEERAQRKFRREADALLESDVPMLGVCFGHQLIAHAFGSRVNKDAESVLRFVKTSPVAEDPLFHTLPKEVMLLESRQEVVSRLPKGFLLLAKSETSPIAAMKHRTRPLYGVQSHPERYSRRNPAGKVLLANFVTLLGR
jgi:GMP synthase (glutamine-hydrolysing)